MKRTLALFLLLALLLPMFAACNTKTPDVTDTPTSDQTSDVPEETIKERPTLEPKETKPADFDDGGNITFEGWSDYVIVTGADCSRSEQTAAKHLQIYIKKISGALLKIVSDKELPAEKELVVGRTNREEEGEFNREELGDEGFIIKTRDKKLFIAGNEKRGTLYGVYTYLENYLGCRFYSQTFEKVPEQDTIPFVEIEEDKQIPVFETRDICWKDLTEHGISAKLKVNGSHGRGAMDEMFGGNQTWAGGRVHTLASLAELDGDGWENEPCLSDEKVYETVLKNVRATIEAHPGAKFVSVSQNDSGGKDAACKCEKCEKVFEATGSRAGMYIKFVNRIAEAIKEDYPDIMVHTLAYRYTKQAPIDVEVADNVMVQFCTIEACFRHALTDCTTCGTDFEQFIIDWSQVCNYLAVWDYTTNFAYYNLSFPNFEAMYHNVKLFADHNVKYIFEQGDYQGTNGEFAELRVYLLARLLWDPYMSREQYYAYMDEFLIDYYGEGGIKIREYIDLMLEETKDICVDIYASPLSYYPHKIITVRDDDAALPSAITADNLKNFRAVDWTPYYEWYTSYTPNVVLTKGEALFKEAYEMAKSDVERQRIEKSSIQITLIRSYFEYNRIAIIEQDMYKLAYNLADKLMGNDAETCDFIAKAISIHVSKQAKSAYANLNKSYYDLMIKHGITHEREGGLLKQNGKYDFTLCPRDWRH
jgi:hypothetical protein